MSNEEYITLITDLLKHIKSNAILKRIYNYINNLFVGRGI